MIELCLDLGLNHLGWSVFKNGVVIDYGVNTGPKIPIEPGKICLREAAMATAQGFKLVSILGRYPYSKVYAELPNGSKSSHAQAHLKMSVGVAVAACAAFGFTIGWVTPREVKLYSVGDESASKKKIKDWAKSKLPEGRRLPRSSDFEHIADSIAVYYAYKKKHKLPIIGGEDEYINSDISS